MADQDSTTAEAAEDQKRTWRDEFLENWMSLHLAHGGLMVDSVQKTQQFVRDLRDRVMNGTLGHPSPSSTTADDMGVSIGNKVFMTPPSQPASAVAAAPSTASKVASGALKMLAGAGMAYAAIDLLRPTPSGTVASQAPAVVDTDTNTRYDFGIYEPEDPHP